MKPRRLLVMLGAAVLSLPAQARQSPPPRDPPPDTRPADAMPGEGQGVASSLRDRLERQLKDLNEEQTRLQRAIGLLDQGASRDDVFRALRPAGPDGTPIDHPERQRERRSDRRDRFGPDERPPGASPDDDRIDWRSPEQRERILAFLGEHLPEVAERFASLNAANPDFASRLISRIGPRIGEIVSLQEREPDLARLKLAELGNALAIIDAFKRAREASDDPARLQAARDTLAARVADQFDIRASLHQNEIERLRRRLDRLQWDLEAQWARRDEDIQQRTDEMMSGKVPMDLFGDGPSRGPRGPEGSEQSDPPRRDDGKRRSR